VPDLTRKQHECELCDKDLREHVKKFQEDGHQNVKIK